MWQDFVSKQSSQTQYKIDTMIFKKSEKRGYINTSHLKQRTEMRHTGANKFIYKLRYFSLKINYTYLFIYLFLGADLEDISQESFLSFFHVFNQIQLLMLSSKHLYPFGHLTGPKVFFNKNFLDYLSVTQLNHM